MRIFLTIPKKKVRNVRNLKAGKVGDSQKHHVAEAQVTPPDSPYYPKQPIYTIPSNQYNNVRA